MTGTLRQAASGYLQTRRSLGYQLQAHGRLLMSYIADLEASGQATVTAANAVAWATGPAGASPVWHARHLSVARRFARYPSATDPSCQVPLAWLLPAQYRRVAPYIQTQKQIDALVHAAGTLGSPLPVSCQAVISVLAATGLFSGGQFRTCPAVCGFWQVSGRSAADSCATRVVHAGRVSRAVWRG